MATLFVEEPEAFPKTDRMLFQEVLSKCGAIRGEMEAGGVYTEEGFEARLRAVVEKDYATVLTAEERDDIASKVLEGLF